MYEVEKRLEEIEKRIKELVTEADKLKNSHPNYSMTAARRACEHMCRQICLKHGAINEGRKGKNAPLKRLIDLIGEHELAPRHIRDDMTTVQLKGNTGTHGEDQLPPRAVIPVLYALANVTDWYFRKYGSEDWDRTSRDQELEEFKKRIREILKNKNFKKLWIATAAGMALALALKIFGKKKGS
jgi:hypothetical protein